MWTITRFLARDITFVLPMEYKTSSADFHPPEHSGISLKVRGSLSIRRQVTLEPLRRAMVGVALAHFSVSFGNSQREFDTDVTSLAHSGTFPGAASSSSNQQARSGYQVWPSNSSSLYSFKKFSKQQPSDRTPGFDRPTNTRDSTNPALGTI